MRDIAHLEPVCSVSQAARELQLRRSPLSRASRNAKVQCTYFIRPNVRRIEKVSRPSAENWPGARRPLVTAKVQYLGRRDYRRGAFPVNNCQRHHAVADDRQRFSLFWRIIGWINQQSGILYSQVD